MTESLNENVTRSLRTSLRTQINNQYLGTKTDTTSYSTVSWNEVRQGSQNPKWRDIVRQHGEAGTAYIRNGKLTYTVGRFSASLFVQHMYMKTGGDNYSYSVDHYYILLPGAIETSANVYNEALGNFLTNINGAISPFKGMVFLGELRETLKMLRHPATTLRDGLSAYLKRALSTGKKLGKRNPKLRKVLQDTWLEYVYGWMPLLDDIKSAAEAYKAFDSREERIFVKGESSRDLTSSNTTNSDAYGNILYNWSQQDTKKDKVRFKGEVLHTFSDILSPAADRVIDLSGFRLGEFLPTVWELLPYSFVIDYFTNIGDILNSISALNAKLAWKSCSRWSSATRINGRRADVSRTRAAFGSTKGKVDLIHDGRPSECTMMNYSRTVPELTVPSLVLHLPGSSWQWVNLAALLGSKI